MFLDTIYVDDTEIVVIALETEAEQAYGDEKLIGIASSQDLLEWSDPDEIDPSIGITEDKIHGQALVTCPDNCRLRKPPTTRSVKVHWVGDATVLVMIRDSIPE